MTAFGNIYMFKTIKNIYCGQLPMPLLFGFIAEKKKFYQMKLFVIIPVYNGKDTKSFHINAGGSEKGFGKQLVKV